MAQRSVKIKASLAEYNFNTKVRFQCVNDLVNEFETNNSMDEFGASVLDQALSIMEEEYEIYENYWWDHENEINSDDDYDELSNEVLETMNNLNRAKDEALDLLDKLESLANANAVVDKKPQNSSKIDETPKPTEGIVGQDDHESAKKVGTEMFMGIVNPDLNDQIPEIIVFERKSRKRGGEVDVPLPSEPKQKVLIIEVECEPIKHFKVMGGSLITNVRKGGHHITNSKCRRHQSTGLRTSTNPMEPRSFMLHRWTNYHRWPPPSFRSFDVTMFHKN